jgi:phosphoribosylanthranilate isomerase
MRANALGFIFYAGSPRYIDPKEAAKIDSMPGVLRVGVFVNERRDRVQEISRMACLHVAQLHGDELPADYPDGMPVWKAARVSAGFDAQVYRDCPAQALLLDGPGSGLTFEWGVAGGLPQKIILAGGLDASNVAQAVATARPWGVDACSRLEIRPGKKDHMKMSQFLKAARVAFSI